MQESQLKGHYTLGFHLAVISKVFKKCNVRSRATVVPALRQQLWERGGGAGDGLCDSQTQQQDRRCQVSFLLQRAGNSEVSISVKQTKALHE